MVAYDDTEYGPFPSEDAARAEAARLNARAGGVPIEVEDDGRTDWAEYVSVPGVDGH